MNANRRDERGAALVEFAIMLPILIVLLFGVIDYGRLLYTRITLHEAVQEGSIYAATHPDDPDGTRLRVIDNVDNPALSLDDITVDCIGSTIRINVAHNMSLIAPIIGPDTITITANVTTDRFSSKTCIPST